MRLAPETLFSALSDGTRLRLLALLAARKEVCVCDLTVALKFSQPMISRHLAQLRAAGMVRDRRAGIWIYYRLHPDLPTWARKVLREALAGVARDAPYRSDRKSLRDASRRRQRCA
jgi:ArsR family transcriptional regulator